MYEKKQNYIVSFFFQEHFGQKKLGFFLHTAKNIFSDGFRALDAFQQPGNNSHRVRHENLERLQKKTTKKLHWEDF